MSQSVPQTVGVFGGSFNPIHLGHALVAVTTQQTKQVDEVVLVPVFRHAVKRDLLPFEDRVAMCRLAVQHFEGITVSTIEQEVGASNGAMLRALKQQYPQGTRFVWICGDDFFRWMHRPKGLETLAEVHGLIVQRRLHRDADSAVFSKEYFYKEAIDEQHVRTIAAQMKLDIDYIYGELPHFSSTLVRRAPGHWRSFLSSAVVQYLDERPHLLQQLIQNLNDEAAKEEQQQSSNTGNTTNVVLQDSMNTVPPGKRQKLSSSSLSATIVLQGLEAVHLLQYERGYAALYLSIKDDDPHIASQYAQAQANTDKLVSEVLHQITKIKERDEMMDEVRALAAELRRIPLWLGPDRAVLQKRQEKQRVHNDSSIDNNKNNGDNSGNNHRHAPEEWLARLDLLEKFNPRIDVLIGSTVRALTESLQEGCSHTQTMMNDSIPESSTVREIPQLLLKWCEGKEALGRERAFVCSGGPTAPALVATSLELRERALQTIDTKERSLARVLTLQSSMSQYKDVLATPKALHALLENLTHMEYTLMGSFASTTPLPLVHKLLAQRLETTASSSQGLVDFDVKGFFHASTASIDFLLSFSKALAASALAGA